MKNSNHNSNHNVYTQNGYDNRQDYLECLAVDYDVDIETVQAMAIDPAEDFDGLVSYLEDMAFDY